MKVVQHLVDGVSIGYGIASFHATGANSNADDPARGKSSGDLRHRTHARFRIACIFCHVSPCVRPARQYAAARHKKVTGFSPSHISS